MRGIYDRISVSKYEFAICLCLLASPNVKKAFYVFSLLRHIKAH